MSFWWSNGAHALGGVILMGSWAFLANVEHPMPAPAKAALVQGLTTAVITVFMKTLMESVARQTTGILPPALAASMTSAVFLTVVHTLGGTPEFWRTVAVPFTVATTYGFVYARALRRRT